MGKRYIEEDSNIGVLKLDGVLVGGEKRYRGGFKHWCAEGLWCAGGWGKIYRGRFKHWCAEFSMVCWWVGKKDIEELSNIGVLSFQWCARGW